MKNTPKPNKPAKVEVSAKPSKSTTARSGSSKNKQTASKPPKYSKGAEKELTAAQKLDAIGEEVLFEQVAEGEFYEDIAKKAGVSRHALMNWFGAREDLYAQAREARADKLAEEIISISDDKSADIIVDENGNTRTDSEVVARSRLRVDSRKWLASKMLPKKYGDRMNLDAEVKFADMSDEQLEAKFSALLTTTSSV